MSGRPPDDEVIFIEDDGGRDDVARALREAERAVSAVEERHRHEDREEEAAVVLEPEAAPASEPVPEAVQKELADLREKLVRAEEESGRMREVLLRKAADFENLKRRTEKEKSEYFKYALTETFRELLAVLDNFERAMSHADSDGEHFRTGIGMIERQLSDVLKRFGLSEIPALGEAFDPNVHEAVIREETDAVSPGTVLEVFQKGWKLNDRLLRPALVKVAGAPQPRAS